MSGMTYTNGNVKFEGSRRTQMKSLFTCAAMVLFLLGDLHGQKTHELPVANNAARDCHQMFEVLKTRVITQLNRKEILDALKKIDDCARGSYPQLTKNDLSAAASLSYSLSLTLMVQMQDDFSQLQAQLDQLTRTSAAASDEMQLTIETLPTNYSRTLTVGGYQTKCTANGPESMNCQGGTFLTAMIARTKGRTDQTVYLIGCPESYNCIPLVPGEFSARMSGNDGLVISGIVREGDVGGTSRHGIYTILDRN